MVLLICSQKAVYFLIALFVVMLLVWVVLYIVNRTKQNPTGGMTRHEHQVNHFLHKDKELDDYTEILSLVKHSVEADGYFLYLPDANKNQHKLECVLYKEEQIKGPLKIGYGRILPYGKQDYDPPLVLPIATTASPSLIKDGGSYVIHAPLGVSMGIILVLRPRKRREYRKPVFRRMIEELEVVLKQLLDNQNIQNNRPEPEEPTQILVSTHDPNEKCMQLIKCSSESDAVLYFSIINHYCDHIWMTGFNVEIENRLRKDENLTGIMEGLANETILVVDFASKEFQQIPSSLNASYSTFTLIRCESGLLVLCYKDLMKQSSTREYRMRFMKLLATKISKGSITYKRNTEKQNLLRCLMEIAKLMDETSPETVGYSELMSGYTAMLCKETKVELSTAVTYERAAALSNIGLVVLPEELWNKDGIYSSKEYQSMQNHVLYGAQIIRTLLADETMEQCIYYHHEQPDGKGYPNQLQGTDIPEGARILRVAQYYISLFKGRSYRKPLTFDQILLNLKNQKGIRIDSVFTQALLGWLDRKQSNPIYKGKPLGSCYEIRCVSEKICRGCPAYKRTDQFCWEFESNNCEAHGNTCPTCSIYTEYQYRNEKEIAKTMVVK